MSAAGQDRTFWLALAVMGVLLVAVVTALAPPAPLPLDAPPDRFSGLRAAETLKFLLGDETPHPVGSPANRAVRDRLLRALEDLGLSPTVQRTVGCHAEYPLCARVENVLAEIPGRTPDALVLMAHYDSVPHAPGAADDGSGVVTLLESARALVLEAPRRNRILLVFTDAEEMGLLGAEGFFADHPWVPDVKAVINIEGSGSGGPSLLLRSSNPGGHLLRAYRDTAEHPQAISYSQEVFARMPNDTDFTVPDRAGIASIDFAFAFEFNHYHTPLDTLANLDKGTLQHHGDNVLPLARRLADMDLSERAANFPYFTVAESFWLTWPTGWTLPLAAMVLLAMAGAGVRLRKRIAVRGALGGFGLAVAGVLLSAASAFAALWVADRIVGTTVDFPANPWPWRLLVFSGSLLPICLLGWWSGRRLDFWSRYLGVWSLLGVLALVAAVVAPLAANLLIIPGLVAGSVAIIALLLADPAGTRLQAAVALVSTAGIAFLFLGVAYAMEETQGYRLAATIFLPVVLIAITLIPLAMTGAMAASLTVVLAGAWIWAAVTPLYSEWRPQHVSLYYVLDRDRGSARWTAISANPLPDRLIDALGAGGEHKPVTPWATGQTFPAFDAEPVPLEPPEVLVERDGERIRVRYRSRESGDFVYLVLPEQARISELTIADREVPTRARDGFVQARFYAAGNDPVEFAFTVGEAGAFEGYLVDGSHTLPASAGPISAARGRLAVPRHQGDQRLAFQRFGF